MPKNPAVSPVASALEPLVTKTLPTAKTAPVAVKVVSAKPAVKPKARPTAKPIVEPKATPARAKAPAKAKQISATKVKPATAQPASKPAAAKSVLTKPVKVKKPKLIRDSFTMPEAEYLMFALIKKRCLAKGVAAKKSEVLRAALAAFSAQTDAALLKAIQALDLVKTGRPPKHSK